MRLRGLFLTVLWSSSAAALVHVVDGRPGPTLAAAAPGSRPRCSFAW